MAAAETPIDRLFPTVGTTSVAAEASAYDPTERVPEDRPFVAVNFATTLDGRAAIGGRSGPIGSRVDSALLMRLRTRFDAVMVGAGTVRAERYGRIVPSPEQRDDRKRQGLASDPLAIIFSKELDLPWDAPIFTCGAGEVLILTVTDREPPETATPIQVARFEGERVDEAVAMSMLRRERGIRTVLCEGGPDLHAELQAAGLVDDLFLTFGPRVSGNGSPGILEGRLPEVREAKLVSVLSSGSELMTRYEMGARTGV